VIESVSHYSSVHMRHHSVPLLRERNEYPFAVHGITEWIRHHADLNRMLPAITTYMGQTGISSTGRYLSLTGTM